MQGNKVRNHDLKRFFSVCVVAFFILTIVMVGTAYAKSIYLASEHHRRLFDAWNINPDGTVTKQATYNLQYSTDPAGIAIDADSETIFITSEFSGGVEMVDPVTLTYLGVSTGPRDLAGIDVDDVDDIVYAVKRYSDDLYIFDWDPVSQKMTQLARIDLPNCSGAFGLALDELRDVLWVADTAAGVVRAYDVDVASWTDIAEITGMRFTPSHKPVDIAVDRRRNFVYTVSIIGGAWVPPGVGSTLLSKYDVATGIETTVDMGHGGVGLTVDEVTGYVYVTGGAYGGDNLSVWDTSSFPFTEIQDTGRIGNPAGIAIGNVSYNPLNLAKNDTIQGYGVYIGQTFTYEITYDNKDNAFGVANVTAVDTLPAGLDFVSEALNGVPGTGVYDPVEHTVTWDIGTLPAYDPGGLIELVVRVNQNAVGETTIYNYCTIESDQTPPTTVEGTDPDNPEPGEPGTYILPNIIVALDIKPGSCPNPLNPKSKGVLPVAILGTEDFDVTMLDPASVRLEEVVAPLRWSLEDVATPFEPFIGKEDADDCTTGGPDGFMDLTLKFDTQEVVSALGDVEDGDVLVLAVTGNLKEEFGGTPIQGEDVVIIRNKGKAAPAFAKEFAFAALSAYPQPCNPETWIPYTLAKDVEVTITIYSSSGRIIHTLQLGHQTAGAYISRDKAAYWNGRNDVGEKVSSGVYFYTLKAGDFIITKKLVVLK